MNMTDRATLPNRRTIKGREMILTTERWALVKPDAFLNGSIVQARNVLEMALHDIAVLGAENERLRRKEQQP
jgi:hypothetical protein